MLTKMIYNKLGAEFHKKFLSDGTAVSFKAVFFIISYMVSGLNSCIQILHTNCRKMNKKIDDFENRDYLYPLLY